MRIDRLSLKGLLRFTDPVVLDFRGLPPGLIAITGENGAGKTTLLEALFGCLHRQLPSRDGELVSYATGRDSYLDAEFSVDGVGAFRARVNLDGPKRGTDAVLEAVLPDGRHVPLNDGKATTYDRAIAERFPSPALMLASAFSAQNRRGNFIAQKPAARKELFGELLGMGHYAAMATVATDCRAVVIAAITRLDVERVVVAADTTESVALELDRIAHALQAQGGTAEVRKRQLAVSLRDLEDRLATLADTTAAYAAASQRLRTLDTELGARQQERAAIDTQRQRVATALHDETARIAAKRLVDLADLTKKIAGNERIQSMAERIRAAVVAVQVVDRTLAELRQLQQDDQLAKDGYTRRKTTLEREIAGLRTDHHRLQLYTRDAAVLRTVPCGGEGAYAACQFLTNATSAAADVPTLEAKVLVLPTRLDELADVVRLEDGYATQLAETRRLLDHQTTEKAKLAELAKYEPALAESNARITELTAAEQKVMADAEETIALTARKADERDAELLADAARLDGLIARLAAEKATAEADLHANESGHAQARVVQDQLASERASWDLATAALARVESGRTELDRRRAELAEKRARLAELDAMIATLQTERAEWDLFARALGKDGLPVLEIDAAGPTISAYTNELLAVCFGTRFTVDLLTQQAKADGKGMKDAFTVAVYDNLRGGEPRDVADLSGGEQTIVAEALMNAIALYANQRNPVPIRTAWRDETTGALDPENAQRYLQMLRKVHDLGGYVHIVFITHNPEVAAMADAQIRVAGGAASVALPPFVEAA